MTEQDANELARAVGRYFDLMYDCDTTTFDRVFYPSAQLHGFREGTMTCWPAAHYKQLLASRESAKSTGAAREDQIISLDFASPTQALAKVRVRIGQMLFVDHLSYHKIDGHWLITAKSYHREA